MTNFFVSRWLGAVTLLAWTATATIWSWQSTQTWYGWLVLTVLAVASGYAVYWIVISIIGFCIAAVIAWQSGRSKAAALAAVLMLPLIAWGGYAISRPALHVAAEAPVAFGAVPPSPYAPPLSRLSQPQGPFQQTGHMANNIVNTVTGLGQAVGTIRPTTAQ
jgi:hypothetical protein